MNRTKILLAQEATIIADIAQSLSCYDVIPVTTLLQAKRMILEDGIDIFVIGIHFDDSSALELVRYIRESQKHCQTPVLVIRVLPSQFAKTLKLSVEAVKKPYDIADYLELEGHADPGWKLREAVNYHLEKSRKTQKMDSDWIIQEPALPNRNIRQYQK